MRHILKENYNYDSTVCFLLTHEGLMTNISSKNTFYALYRSFTQCAFVEEEGGIVFYKNKLGQAAREVAEDVVHDISQKGWVQSEQDRLE